MLFNNFLQAIFAGSLVSFAAQQNGHVEKLIHQQELGVKHKPGYSLLRKYQCSSNSLLLRRFNLSTWLHTHHLKMVEKDKVVVHDTMVWSQRTASRVYTVQQAPNDAVVYHSEGWSIHSAAAYNRALNVPIARKMNHLDQVIFSLFISTLKKEAVARKDDQ